MSPYSPSTLAMDREWCYADKALDSRTAELIGYLQQSYFRVFASADACCFTTGKLPASKVMPCNSFYFHLTNFFVTERYPPMSTFTSMSYSMGQF